MCQSTTEADVRAALDQVIHPSFGLSLVALGMIAAIRASPGEVEVDLVMNCAGCPGGEAVLALAQNRLRGLGGQPLVTLRVLPRIWQPPWDMTAII